MTETKVNLNQADTTELAELPGIGQKLAEKIVAHRQEHGYFSEPADLAAVPGVSEQMVDELERHLIVQAPERETEPDSDRTGAQVEEEKNKAKAAKKPAAAKAGEEPQLQALREAARAGDTARVKALIEGGANGRDKFALLWAAQEGRNEVVAELIQAGADVNSRSAAGGPNALALAAQNGHLQVVQTLIEAGANVNEPAMQGWTPLMKAAFFGHDEIVQSLLEVGAEIRVQDTRGRTAADHAQRADNKRLATLLVR